MCHNAHIFFLSRTASFDMEEKYDVSDERKA
jgi:hypothetical protein